MCAKSPVPLLDRLVLVHDDQKNRLLWPMGITCKLHISADGHVQSNQKMHDLYATMHIFQMALPNAFWAVWSQIFS